MGRGGEGSGGGEGVRDADRLAEGGAAQGSGEWEGDEGRGGGRSCPNHDRPGLRNFPIWQLEFCTSS